MSKKREAILATASELFGQFGYQAVGIDTIIANANVAKMTFYSHFKSKDQLVECILTRRDASLRQQVSAAMATQKTPIKQLEAIFRWYENWFQQPTFYGCMFVKAVNEYADKNPSVLAASRQYSAWLTQTIYELMLAMKVKQPLDNATLVVILLDGLTLKQSMDESFDARACAITWRLIKQLAVSSNVANLKRV